METDVGTGENASRTAVAHDHADGSPGVRRALEGELEDAASRTTRARTGPSDPLEPQMLVDAVAESLTPNNCDAVRERIAQCYCELKYTPSPRSSVTSCEPIELSQLNVNTQPDILADILVDNLPLWTRNDRDMTQVRIGLAWQAATSAAQGHQPPYGRSPATPKRVVPRNTKHVLPVSFSGYDVTLPYQRQTHRLLMWELSGCFSLEEQKQMMDDARHFDKRYSVKTMSVDEESLGYNVSTESFSSSSETTATAEQAAAAAEQKAAAAEQKAAAAEQELAVLQQKLAATEQNAAAEKAAREAAEQENVILRARLDSLEHRTHYADTRPSQGESGESSRGMSQEDAEAVVDACAGGLEPSFDLAELGLAAAEVAREPYTARYVHDLLWRHCVKGDTFCQDYAILCALGLLEHGRPSPLHEPAEESTPTQRDRALVCRLRHLYAGWMERQEEEWCNANLYRLDANGQVIGRKDPRTYQPRDGYVNGEFALELEAYGDLNTLMAASEVLGIDVASMDENQLDETTRIPFFTEGKQCTLPSVDVCTRIQTPTLVPLVVLFWNGVRGRSGHYAAGVYRRDGERMAAPGRWMRPCLLIEQCRSGLKDAGNGAFAVVGLPTDTLLHVQSECILSTREAETWADENKDARKDARFPTAMKIDGRCKKTPLLVITGHECNSLEFGVLLDNELADRSPSERTVANLKKKHPHLYKSGVCDRALKPSQWRSRASLL